MAKWSVIFILFACLPLIFGCATASAPASCGGTSTSSGTLAELSNGEGFDFDTGNKVVTTSSCCDLYATQGGKMDIGGGFGNAQNIYDFSTTYASLETVPSSASGGSWGYNIKGSGGLAGRGFIIRNIDNGTLSSKYYRVWINLNDLPTLKFYWQAI
ncbi:MAG: hypothetical protein FD145_815 [Candidatus Saganbacteria bacterium]|uniref:Uncharacterized protein n=1 Tax=Candidatus Saganbacteria bacterium TaxID=2575572 RepID=A0A833L112_UNCSA|nr:MAG: hypothetical protein FD145_815 [Candidatus Saganbacteria bacterium]